jgi:hypothetical protein
MAIQKRTIGRPSAWRIVMAGLLLLGGQACFSATAGQGVNATSSLERHWTSNALDSDHAITDWYALLRGALEWKSGGDDSNATLGAEFQVTRYDTVSIEDDRAVALTAQAFRRLPSGIELKGTLSYRASSEGDDLTIGPLVLGTRTLKQVFAANGQIGIDLGDSTSLILEASDSFEKVGTTHFQHDLILPAQLDPDRNRAQIGALLMRTAGPYAFSASGSALRVSVDKLGSPPVALSLAHYALRGEFTYTATDGSTLAAALGGEWLRGDDAIYSSLRPSWQITFARKLPRGFELRGAYFGRFETADSDDPLASWLQRGELEFAAKLGEDLTLAAGVYSEAKENLLFENVERKRGLYAELTCQAAASTAIMLRLDFSRTLKTVIDERQQTIDAFVGLRAKI